MQVSDIQSRTKRLVELMEKHLGTRGPTLERALRRAGRRLPRGLRDKGQLLVEAERMAEHPRLMQRVDAAAVDAAFRDLSDHLRTIDRAEARKTRTLNIAAALAFNLLLVVALLIAFLRWRGLI